MSVTEPPMKILVIHNYYQNPGGEDAVCEEEMALLRRMARRAARKHAITTTNEDRETRWPEGAEL